MKAATITAALALLIGTFACGAGVRRNPLGLPAHDAAANDDGSMDGRAGTDGSNGDDLRDASARDDARADAPYHTEVDVPQGSPDTLPELGPPIDAPVVDLGLPLGADCSSEIQCASGHCEDG